MIVTGILGILGGLLILQLAKAGVSYCLAVVIVALAFTAARAYADYLVEEEQAADRETRKEWRRMFEDARREGRERALRYSRGGF